ncbi:hypothetical protein FQN54_003339 [Arachnomyces sp. PD_36]|nr:hypothetical protein FQN54_003339 [Arachnomyces sp. PD_36]
MSAPNFGDVVKALEICLWIKKNCFDPTSHADVKYAEFKKDITDLHRRLDQFKATFETALRHTDDADSFKREADELIGDFKSTLQQCQELLRKYVKSEQGKPTPLNNAFWHTSPQLKINELRERIQSHTNMIALIIEPVQLQINTRTLENTEFIIQLLTEPQKFIRNTPLPEIHPDIDARLRDALNRSLAPEGLNTTRIPLKEGIIVLSLQYQQSTAPSTNSGDTQPIKQHLCLLKAHWLLKALTTSKEFGALRPGHLYRQILMQLDQGIAKQYAREDTPQLNEDRIRKLSASEFIIWPEKKFKQTDSTESGTPLAKLALVPEFQNQKEELSIFKADDTTLRTVHSTTPFDKSLRPRDTVRDVDLHSGGLVPLYFISSSEQKWNFQIVYGKTVVAYELQSREDALNLQLAFTGFKVEAYSEAVSFTATYQKSGWTPFVRDSQKIGHGEIQLWQWPVEENPLEPPLTPRTSEGSGKRSLRSASGYSFASQSFIDLDTNIVSVMQTDDGREIVISRLPPPPLLMAFTNNNGIYTIWQVDISDLDFAESHAHRRIILHHRHKKTFKIWRLSVNESELASWDICSLVPANNGKVRGGQFAKSLDCTWLDLEFPSEQRKKRFTSDLVTTSTLTGLRVHYDESAPGNKAIKTTEFHDRLHDCLDDDVSLVETETERVNTDFKAGSCIRGGICDYVGTPSQTRVPKFQNRLLYFLLPLK